MLIYNTAALSQSVSNLERINSLIDSSSYKIVSVIEDTSNSFSFENNIPQDYSTLTSRVISGLNKNGIILGENESDKIIYTLSHAGVEYTDLFRDGLFGEYLLERKFDLKGNYVITESDITSQSDTFELTLTDTIRYDNLVLVENNSLPFTKAIPPSEPFVPSIIEPVIAITAIAVTVILFFTVRSK